MQRCFRHRAWPFVYLILVERISFAVFLTSGRLFHQMVPPITICQSLMRVRERAFALARPRLHISFSSSTPFETWSSITSQVCTCRPRSARSNACLLCLSAEEIAEGQEFDARDLQRFKDIDEYATMFLQHAQIAATFNQELALQIFHSAMSWRKKNNVYGRPMTLPSKNLHRSFSHCPQTSPPINFLPIISIVKESISKTMTSTIIRYVSERAVLLVRVTLVSSRSSALRCPNVCQRSRG